MPSGTHLDLPFAYAASVLPGHRHTKPREVTLRGTAIVEVPHLSIGDLTKVVDLMPGTAPMRRIPEPPCTVYERNGRLYAAMTASESPVAVSEFPELLRRSLEGRRDGLDKERYPTRDTRHRSWRWNALSEKTLGEVAIAEHWPAPRVVATDHDDALGAAVAYLSEAIAIVDGIVFAECCEPVWRLQHEQYNTYVLVYALNPTARFSHLSFRLDQRDRALEYAASRRWRVDRAEAAPTSGILQPSAIERNDLREIGAASLRAWRADGYMWQHHRSLLAEPIATLHTFRTEREVAMHDVPTVMDAIVALTQGPGLEVAPRARNHAGADALFGAAKRWAFEKANVDLGLFDPAMDDDWLALQGLTE